MLRQAPSYNLLSHPSCQRIGTLYDWGVIYDRVPSLDTQS